MGFKRKYNVNERRCKDKSSNNEGGNYKPFKLQIQINGLRGGANGNYE